MPDDAPQPPKVSEEATRLRAELERTRADLAEAQAAGVSLRAALEASHLEVAALYASLSWRVTRPLRFVWDFIVGLPSFLRELPGFPRRVRYTLATRGFAALRSDIASELVTRLRHGSLAAAREPAYPMATLPFAARVSDAERLPLHLPRPSEPLVSIVIPAYNEFSSTYACLASILERSGEIPYEVVVADDGSSDETREIEHVAPGVRVVRSESNHGFIDACNRGAAAARGEFLVFLNNDTLVPEGWLERFLEPFDEADVGLVGAKLVYPDGRLQEAGGILFADGSGWNYGRGDDPANPKYEFRCDVHYCSGACIAIRRELFHELGAFDTRYAPMYYEDVDLAFAVRASGRRVVYQPACVIVHAEGGTAGVDTGSGPKRYQVRNQRIFVEKWGETLSEQPVPASNPDASRYRPSGPHVLVIDSYTPRSDHDAGSLRMVNIFHALRRLGCHVSFLPENRAHDGEYTRALQAAGVEAIYHPYLPSLEQHLKDFGGRYHAVLMSRVDVADQVLDAVRRHCPQARRVFDTVDLHFLREARRAELPDLRAGSQAERLMQQELRVARACDVTLVVSTAEKEVLEREAPDIRVEVLSLIHRPEPTQTPFAERAGILFIGNFQHPPNIDAVKHYLQEVHPALRERLPGVSFTVIGANVPKSLERLAGDGVRFVGHVPDVRPLFSAARLSVAPLRYGAGIKGKISSSIGFGVPVVTTTIGAEGMELGNGEHVLIEDRPEAFADAVVALYSDEALWARLVEGGLRSVTSQFAVERAEATLARVLDLPAAARSAHEGAGG